MPLIDDKNKLFGKLHLVDACAFLFGVLVLVAVFVYTQGLQTTHTLAPLVALRPWRADPYA